MPHLMSIDDLIQRTLDLARQRHRPPESTCRIQFHAGFTFRDAITIVPYLADLGVTHVYASPYLKARAGSTHGYDVIDPCALNPEIGSEADHAAFCDALREHGLSHILDIVPNHMGIGTNENKWWNDVLANGPASRYADFFDISWRGSTRAALHDKVLLPVLGAPYGEVLERRELTLAFEQGEFVVCYYDRRFPVSPDTREQAAAVFAAKDRSDYTEIFDQLLNRQHYRLAWWRVASDEINYRRFFDINDLAGLRMEREDVFEATHALIFRLLIDGKVTGLRVDHPDGLYDPKQYFERLQQHYLLGLAKKIFETGDDNGDWCAIADEVRARLSSHADAGTRLYVIAEKILAADESLPQAWAVDGTSGYDFLNQINGLFVEPAGEAPLTRLYQDWTGDSTTFPESAYQKKRLILDISLASELQMLTQQLDELAQSDRRSRDFTLRGLHDALREVIACFGVYRSYITEGSVDETDRRVVRAAIEAAAARTAALSPAIFRFIEEILLNPSSPERARFAGRFQQLTAPATAKGVEDTAFYTYNRLISLNEVGGDPARFGHSPEALHEYLNDRQTNWPHALSALSTHDTKRSEDVRARINVLSEIPDDWRKNVEQWRVLNAPHRSEFKGAAAPSPGEEYLLYQALVGAWPMTLPAAEELQQFAGRIKAFMTKALREAKVHTSWTQPNEAYEQAVDRFIDAALSPAAPNLFLEAFMPFAQRVSHSGALNSLWQTVLRLTAPGAPDTYQGSELWDLSLVDPDNRRPVDYQRRIEKLSGLRAAADNDAAALGSRLLRESDDGRIKLMVTSTLLRCRREHAGLFSRGQYIPLGVSGACGDHVFAFARRLGDAAAVVVVPRLMTKLVSAPRVPCGDEVWRDTRVQLPPFAADRSFTHAFTRAALRGGSFAVGELMHHLPFAVLIAP